MLLTHFGLGPPGCHQTVCWTGKHSTVWDSCCLQLLLLQDLQMPVSIMLQSRHSDKEAIFQYEEQFLINYLNCQYIWEMDVWVYLKVASVGFSEGFQLMLGMPMASAIKGDDVFRVVTSQSTEVHVITQDLGVVFVFPNVLRKSLFFLWWIFFYVEHVLWTVFSQGVILLKCETLLKKAVVRNPAVNFIISVTFFNIFWWCSCVRDKCCVSP